VSGAKAKDDFIEVAGKAMSHYAAAGRGRP
jgi:hypothetical protein